MPSPLATKALRDRAINSAVAAGRIQEGSRALFERMYAADPTETLVVLAKTGRAAAPPVAAPAAVQPVADDAYDTTWLTRAEQDSIQAARDGRHPRQTMHR
jgi:hypothetical protein